MLLVGPGGARTAKFGLRRIYIYDFTFICHQAPLVTFNVGKMLSNQDSLIY